MIGTIETCEPLACIPAQRPRRTCQIRSDQDHQLWTGILGEMVPPQSETNEKDLIGRRVAFSNRGQSDAVRARLLDSVP